MQRVQPTEPNLGSTCQTYDSFSPSAHVARSRVQVQANEYAELKQRIKLNGLLEKKPHYDIRQFLFLGMLLTLSLIFLSLSDNLWLQLLDAACLAFIFAQSGFIGHDACHQQIFRASWKNDIIALIFGNLLVGFSRQWWTDKHNQHHGNPNQMDLDPDINIPVFAFSTEQACNKQGCLRFIAKYQAYLFIPFLSLEAFSMQFHSIHFLLHKRVKYQFAETLLLIAHFGLYFGILFSLLGIWHAIIFILVHQALLGIYLGMSFASNHKGMLLLDKDEQIDFLHRQVLTTRNLKAHPISDYAFGSLSSQIEHHLFPNMPRNNLRKAEKIVKDFCQEKAIEYYETSVMQSYKEILLHLHQVGAPLRAEKENARKQ